MTAYRRPSKLSPQQREVLHQTLGALADARDQLRFLRRCEAFGAFRPERTEVERKAEKLSIEAEAVVQQLWHLLDGIDHDEKPLEPR